MTNSLIKLQQLPISGKFVVTQIRKWSMKFSVCAPICFRTPKGKVFHFNSLLVFVAISRKISHKTNEKSIKEEEKVFRFVSLSIYFCCFCHNLIN